MGRSYIVHSACIWVLRRVYGAEFVCVANANACACAEKQREREIQAHLSQQQRSASVASERERERTKHTDTHVWRMYVQTNQQTNKHTHSKDMHSTGLTRAAGAGIVSILASSVALLFRPAAAHRIFCFTFVISVCCFFFFASSALSSLCVDVGVGVCVCCVHIRNSSFLTLKWPHQMYVVRVWNVQ